jgi:hypothetical protein
MKRNRTKELQITNFPWKAVGDNDQTCNVTIDKDEKVVFVTTDEPAGSPRWFAFHLNDIPVIVAALRLAIARLEHDGP